MGREPWWLTLFRGLFTIVFFGTIGWGLLLFIRWLQRSAERSQQSAFEGLQVSNVPGPGDVEVVFHAYHGFIAYTRQTEYRFWAKPDDARVALKRLHYSNLKWGFFAYGALVIPLVSYGNLLSERGSIRRQERSLRIKPSKSIDPDF